MLLSGGVRNSFVLGSPAYDLTGAATYTSTVGAVTGTTLTDAAASPWTAGAFNATGSNVWFVEVTSGAGIGQRRAIISNTGNKLTLAYQWTVSPAAGDSYVIAADVANIHFAEPDSGIVGTVTYDGVVAQFTGTDSVGDLWSHNGTHPVTVTRNILLPNGMGDNSFTPLSNGADTGALSLTHNTWFMGDQFVNVSEQTPTVQAGVLAALEDNIAWVAPGRAYWQHGSDGPYLVEQCAGSVVSTCTSGYVTAANADYNDTFNMQTGYAKSALGATGIGYNVNAASGQEPGQHDLHVDPLFVDATRSFWSWAKTAACGSTAATMRGQIADGLACMKANPTLTRTSLIPY